MKAIAIPYLSWYISKSGFTPGEVAAQARHAIPRGVMVGQQGASKDLAFRLSRILRCTVDQLQRGPLPDLVVDGLPVAWCADNGCQLTVYCRPFCATRHLHMDRTLGRQWSNCTLRPGPQQYFLKLLSTAVVPQTVRAGCMGQSHAMGDWMNKQEDGEAVSR